MFLIAVIAFISPVNCQTCSTTATLGIPFIRTSVDHGTALDIAGTGAGEHASLLTALLLATELVAR